MNAPAAAAKNRWDGAWLDLVAFAGGLALAWFAGWQTTDLVWSLWLSSFAVGYALVVWNVSAPLRDLLGGLARDSGAVDVGVGAKAGAIGLFGVGTLFGLAFFTVHFGGFHFVHSVFLNVFFPIADAHGFPGWSTYAEVLRRYWIFLPLAFLAERAAFKQVDASGPPDTAVTPEAIARRKAQAANSGMMAPYKGVIRMHLLIFFFFFAHVVRLENFAVYAVVYAVYFFPWRVLRAPAVANVPRVT